MTPSAVRKMIEPVLRRIQLAIARAVVAAIDDTKKMQRMQVSLLEGEGRDSVERFQNYGFTSHPKKGSEAVVIFPSGNRDHGLIIAVDDRRYRLVGMKEGEVAIYSDEGDYIHFQRGKKIEIKTTTLVAKTTTATVEASGSVTVDTPKATFTTDVEIKGKLDVTGNISSLTGEISDQIGPMSEMREIFDEHEHPENGDGGGVTDPPNQQM